MKNVNLEALQPVTPRNTDLKRDNYHLLPKQTYLREARRMIKEAGCKTRKDWDVGFYQLFYGAFFYRMLHLLSYPVWMSYIWRGGYNHFILA